MNKPEQALKMRSTDYVEHRVDTVWDVLSNPDYLVMHPENASLKNIDKIEIHPWGGAIATAGQVLINYFALMPKQQTGICMQVFKQLFFAQPVMWMFNAFISNLDRLYYRPNPVMGYIVIARK